MSHKRPEGGQQHSPLDPKKLLREAIAGGDADYAADSWLPPALTEIEARFPELDVVELIGRGGMGAVYRVVQRKLDRTVALKVLPPELAKDPAFEERFLREARALAGLKHERILTLHDFGERDGVYYLMTEFVDGMNLRQLMDMGELSPLEALRITPQICEALQCAHDHGVVHRDIKPENLLIDLAGEVRIADFGLARILGDARPSALTRSTQALGTPQYMAPEQWRDGQTVDHRADIYAVGVVLYEMLTGQLPIGHFDPPSRRKGVPEGLDEVVHRTLAQRPERRYQQASEVSDELARQAIDSPGRPAKSPSSSRFTGGGSRADARVRAPWQLHCAWIVLLLSPVAAFAIGEQLKASRLSYQRQHDGYEYVHRAAFKWAKASGRRLSDVNGRHILADYYKNHVWPEWDRRHGRAGAGSTAVRPELPSRPGPHYGYSVKQLLPLCAVPFMVVMLCGFAAVRRVCRARNGTAWLGWSIVTAWAIPVVVMTFLPLVVLPWVAVAINYHNLLVLIAAATLASVFFLVGGVMSIVRLYRRLAQDL